MAGQVVGGTSTVYIQHGGIWLGGLQGYICHKLMESHGCIGLQGVHHTAEAEKRPGAGGCSGAYSECVAAAPRQKERLVAHPQDAANQRRPLPAASGQPGQVRPCAMLMICPTSPTPPRFGRPFWGVGGHNRLEAKGVA